MSAEIEPRVLKGFRDMLPDKELQRQAVIKSLEQAFRLFGFVPIDTPVLEYADVLLGKGGGETDKQVYRFTHGGHDMAMRFDLTVPFARFMAAHVEELPLPFRRYHIAKVWRGENTQRGRYREFMQADFDIVGVDSAAADLEVLLLIRECMRKLGIPGFHIHYAHRGALNSFLSTQGLTGKAVEVMRIMDKERKIGPEKTRELLAEEAGAGNAEAVLGFARREGTLADTLKKLSGLVGAGDPSIARLSEVSRSLEDLGAGDDYVLDPSITRGLDYYTGIVCETFIDKCPEVGSVCSGGRYNELASLYTRRSLPGIGASVGVDRLLTPIEDLGLLANAPAGAEVLVLNVEDSLLPSYQRFAAALREAGISAEVFPERKKLGAQFGSAEKKGTRLALIHGGTEAASGTVNLKDLKSREEHTGLTLAAAIEKAKQLLR